MVTSNLRATCRLIGYIIVSILAIVFCVGVTCSLFSAVRWRTFRHELPFTNAQECVYGGNVEVTDERKNDKLKEMIEFLLFVLAECCSLCCVLAGVCHAFKSITSTHAVQWLALGVVFGTSLLLVAMVHPFLAVIMLRPDCWNDLVQEQHCAAYGMVAGAVIQTVGALLLLIFTLTLPHGVCDNCSQLYRRHSVTVNETHEFRFSPQQSATSQLRGRPCASYTPRNNGSSARARDRTSIHTYSVAGLPMPNDGAYRPTNGNGLIYASTMPSPPAYSTKQNRPTSIMIQSADLTELASLADVRRALQGDVSAYPDPTHAPTRGVSFKSPSQTDTSPPTHNQREYMTMHAWPVVQNSEPRAIENNRFYYSRPTAGSFDTVIDDGSQAENEMKTDL